MLNHHRHPLKFSRFENVLVAFASVFGDLHKCSHLSVFAYPSLKIAVLEHVFFAYWLNFELIPREICTRFRLPFLHVFPRDVGVLFCFLPCLFAKYDSPESHAWWNWLVFRKRVSGVIEIVGVCSCSKFSPSLHTSWVLFNVVNIKWVTSFNCVIFQILDIAK